MSDEIKRLEEEQSKEAGKYSRESDNSGCLQFIGDFLFIGGADFVFEGCGCCLSDVLLGVLLVTSLIVGSWL